MLCDIPDNDAMLFRTPCSELKSKPNEHKKISYTPVQPLRRRTWLKYLASATDAYSALEPFRPVVLISPPLVSRRRRTI